MCTDVNFRAADLISLIEPQITEMEEQDGRKVEPWVHPKIGTLREFVETFAYHFSHGVNAEKLSESDELFFMLLDTLKNSSVTHRSEIGGHSAVWAVRA